MAYRKPAGEPAPKKPAKDEEARGAILSELRPPRGSKSVHFRKGRGVGSGNGKTAGKGTKGQRARAGGRGGKRGFEGGQMRLFRRIPKRGFRNPDAVRVAAVNVGDLDVFAAGAEVTIEALREKKLLKGRFEQLKILGDGDLTKKLTVKAHSFSESAKTKIEQAGGKAEVLSRPQPAATSTQA
jgi:large subunit ribosomal protein L15